MPNNGSTSATHYGVSVLKVYVPCSCVKVAYCQMMIANTSK